MSPVSKAHADFASDKNQSNLEAVQAFVELLGKEPGLAYRFIMDSAALAVAEELDV